jgi:diguanylate cyclase (GGDEF)-like protein/PAS domain S-box-containing protein
MGVIVSRRSVVLGYVLCMAVAGGLYYAVPAWHTIAWGFIGGLSAAAVAAGIRLNKPRRPGPWLLIAASALAFVIGDTYYSILTDVLQDPNPFPSIGDAFYLAGFFPLLLAGLLLLLKSGAGSRDSASLLDALTVTAGLGLLSWIFLINPIIQQPDLSLPLKLISVAYPLYDVLVLTVLIRMATELRRSPTVAMLATALAALLAADAMFLLLQISGTWALGGVVDALWAVFYVGLGVAALHPSMVDLTAPRVLRRTEVSRGRVAVLGLASLIPPAVLFIQATGGHVENGVTIALLSAALFTLVVARLSGVVAVHRQAIGRERGLRRAGASLLEAANGDEVAAAVQTAVAELLPRDTPHRVFVTTGDRVGEPSPAEPLDMVYINTLPADIAAELNGFDIALRSHLGSRRCAGTLYVAGPESALVALQESADVVASQGTLALESIAANAESAKRDSEAYFRTLVLNAADVILILDEENRIRYASPSASAMFGFEDLIGVGMTDLVDEPERAGIGSSLDAVRDGGRQPDLDDWTVLHGGATQVQAEVSCRDLRHERTVQGLVVTLRDVTERRRLERELIHRAYYDALTGLPNRSLFQDRIERAASRAQQTGATAGVLVVGLDDFKVVNDTMGHDAGDELLVAVGQRLVAAVHPYHSVARMGGDEFAVAIESAGHTRDLEETADRLLATLAQPFQLERGVVTCHASVGIASTADASGGQELLSQADIALAMAKTSGKARWRRYESSLHTKILERLQLRAALDQAIADGELLLHYQPIVDIKTGRVEGLEALVRWQHPTKGLIPPLDFIQVAEESGLIVPLGAWVLRTAVAAATQWQRLRPLQRLYVSVNVSARQFRTAGFVEQVQRMLEESGLPPQCLVLEITESLLLDDNERVWSDLARLRESGIRVAIDDFGTGYSSLSYLHQVPIDIVKLDRSFVRTISTSEQQFDLVKGIVRLAHTLFLKVVAEGIETGDDLARLAETGCEYGQGYLFARPMRQEDAAELLLVRESLIEAAAVEA